MIMGGAKAKSFMLQHRQLRCCSGVLDDHVCCVNCWIIWFTGILHLTLVLLSLLLGMRGQSFTFFLNVKKAVLLDYIKILTKKYMCLMLQRKIISLVYELGGWTGDPRGFFPPALLCFCGNWGKIEKLSFKIPFMEQDGRRPSFHECTRWVNKCD